MWWRVAFVWILFSPVVTAPWQAMLVDPLSRDDACLTIYKPGREPGGPDRREGFLLGDIGSIDHWECPADPYVATYLPGLLNLAPLGFLLSKSRRTRLAGLLAGSLGLVRLAVPALMVMSADTVDVAPFIPFIDGTPVVSALLWCVSLAAFIWFWRNTRDIDILTPDSGLASP